MKRQDASTRSDRADKDYAQKKRDYELRLDRLQCRNCGTFQSYDEFIDKRTKCPADICETGFYYAPQQVFNRDLVGDFKKLINKALAEFAEEGKIDEEAMAEIDQMKLGLEPSEKAIVDKMLKLKKKELNPNLVKQKADQTKKMKEVALQEENEKKAKREEMIKLTIEAKEKEVQDTLQSEMDRKARSVRRMFDKESRQVVDVVFEYDQPVGKLVPAPADEDGEELDESMSISSSKKSRALTMLSRVIPWVPNGAGFDSNGHVQYRLQKFVKKPDPRDPIAKNEVFEAFGVLESADSKVDGRLVKKEVQIGDGRDDGER